MNSYAVVGTGAVGGFYGALLQKAGNEVHFLLHSDYDHVAQNGLVVDSKDGDFSLPHVKAYARAEDMPRCDVTLVTLKATHNHLLADILPHVVKIDGGMVVLMQNGLGQEDAITRIVPQAGLAAGLCFICSTKIGPGHIKHLDYGRIRLAEHNPRDHKHPGCPNLSSTHDDLKSAGIDVRILPDLLTARWRKLVWNIPFNGLGVALQADTRQLLSSPKTAAMVRDLMDEVVKGAASCGRPIPDSFVETMISDTRTMEPYTTSMQVDFERKRPMEVEAIFGEPLRASSRAGAVLPKIEALYAQLTDLNREVCGA